MDNNNIASDALRCDAVWQRILPQLRPYPELRQDTPEQGSPDAKGIDELIEQKLKDRCAYIALSRAAPTRAEARALCAMAVQVLEQVRRLRALHYIMTGAQSEARAQRVEQVCCYKKALRERYLAQRSAARRMEAAAGAAGDGDEAALLKSISLEDSQRASLLFNMLA